MLTAIIFLIAVVSLFFITKSNTQKGAELSYTDISTMSEVVGSVVPASCDSTDWRGSYCADAPSQSVCHANSNISFCPTDGLSCQYYDPAYGYPHSGSHFLNDCQAPCPLGGYYDPFNDPEAKSCPDIKVVFARNCTLPWGETIASGDSRNAYLQSSAASCMFEKRICNDGTLSGSFTNQSCTRTGGSGGGGGGGGCFVAGTKVTLADGTHKNIEDVQDTDTLMSSSGPVAIEKRLRIEYEGDVFAFNGDGKYFVTPSHPFMTTEGWKSIDPAKTHEEIPDLKVTKLTVGDTLILEGGRELPLTSMQSKHEITSVYNFQLEGTHDYYADGFLVHNKVQAF
jgi:hypothetical protein